MSIRGQYLKLLIEADIRDWQVELEGELLSKPALLRTDGANLTYAADVKISGYDEPLRNVPIALGNRELEYACSVARTDTESGSPVTLRRNGQTGRLEIVGFSKRGLGKMLRIPVDLTTLTQGPTEDRTLRSRLLTFGELGDAAYGAGFGQVPLGAYGLFRGTTLLEVRS